MQRSRLFLILATACLLLHAGATTETVTTCGAHVHRLECESGVISVDASFYGRADTGTCAGGKSAEEVANTACSHTDTLVEVKNRCNGKQWCELNANVMEDPCSGTFKYMKTSYSCVPAIHRVVCEHSMASLHCDVGKVIKVLGADFGRRDHVTCAFRRTPSLLAKIDCTNPTHLLLAQKCDGRNSCEMRASVSVINQSCMDTSHYLEYAYTCNDA